MVNQSQVNVVPAGTEDRDVFVKDKTLKDHGSLEVVKDLKTQ